MHTLIIHWYYTLICITWNIYLHLFLRLIKYMSKKDPVVFLQYNKNYDNWWLIDTYIFNKSINILLNKYFDTYDDKKLISNSLSTPPISVKSHYTVKLLS